MITEYPAYLQKIDIDGLRQFVPAGETFYTVIFKEVMDNALDACEKADNIININYADDHVSIKNKGAIPDRILKNLSKPDINTSEKYRQYSFKRGAIGQGLKLAIAMSTLEDKDFFISTGNKCLTINISDRLSFNPENIFNIYERDITGAVDTTEISFYGPLDNIDNIMIYRYIIVNPHITFTLNNKQYKATADIKKCLKNDIEQYRNEDIDKLCQFYSKPDIADSFNISNQNKKEILKSGYNFDHFAGLLSRYAKPVKPVIFGLESIKSRLRQINDDTEITGYKKIQLNNGILELTVFNGDYTVISVNESLLSDDRLWLYDAKHNMQISLGRLLSDTKFKQGLIAIYHCSRPEFQDANKQVVIINTDEPEFNKIKNFLKAYGGDKRTSYDNWHLCSNKEELTEKIVSIANKMYQSMNLPITIRQLYYQLVSKGVIVNGKYNTLDAYLTYLRKNNILDWKLFEDRNRNFHKIATIEPSTNINDLILSHIANLELPPVDKWYDQPYYVELWYEKDALSTYFQHIADKWHILCFANRGYNSFTMNSETLARFIRNKNKHIILLYCGDFDPHGFGIYENLKKELNIEIKRIALTSEQIEKFNLIEMPELKGTEKIKSQFKVKYGNKAYELDALPAKELMNILDNAVSRYYDYNLYDDSKQQENIKTFQKIKENIINNMS
ncbi:MAG: hypothetical protein ACYCTB_10780 [bacterium]